MSTLKVFVDGPKHGLERVGYADTLTHVFMEYPGGIKHTYRRAGYRKRDDAPVYVYEAAGDAPPLTVN